MNTTYGNEYILLDTAGKGNGVYLKYIRMHVIGVSGHWWESRIRIYNAYDSPTKNYPTEKDKNIISPWTPYHYGDYSMFGGFDANSEVIFISSGLEDFYLSSWNGSNLTSFNNKESGLLYQSNLTIASTSTISFYRNFSKSMPGVGPGRRLVVTLNSGDEQVGGSGSFHVVGVAYYYD